MFRFLDDIIASEKSLEIAASKFNHCSSICPLFSGSLLAWYSGTRECQDNQSVHLVFINKNHPNLISDTIRIGDKTGNPIVWNTASNQAILLYSKFEDTGTIYRLADRWKHCSLWIQHVKFEDRIQLVGDPIKIAEPIHHLLARCSPIVHDGRLLLPLYDEVNAQGVVAEFKNDSIEFVGRIGRGMIQPTLWTDNGRIHSLSRNFGNNKSLPTLLTSQHSYSDDGGATWTEPKNTDIPNNNSSLHVLSYDKHNYILWNDTIDKRRRLMTIGELIIDDEKVTINRMKVMDRANGSYPSMAVINNRLVFTFTSFGKIRYYEWNRKKLRDRRRNPN